MSVVYLSLGSNIGDREGYLKKAIAKLAKSPRLEVDSISSIYETDPVGYTDQDQFLNLVVQIETTFAPLELLDYIQQIELDLDRTREIHWGPRTIDIDIILFGKQEIESDRLVIPHPRFHKRAFVLKPLADLTDKQVYQGQTPKELLAQLPKSQGIKEYQPQLEV
ncbi:MAG: 2-amino-4-hydroxy-6-hydroxymethyldihydropteridine diphosphokinase [Bacillota bacterium]